MIERVHEHIIGELQTNTRTDVIFILTAIILNLITLGINAGFAQGGSGSTQAIIMSTLWALSIVVNLVAEIGLIRGKQTRTKLLNGLLKMYKDQGVEGYYDVSLLGDYKTRYNLFMFAVLFTGLIALIIPFVLLFT